MNSPQRVTIPTFSAVVPVFNRRDQVVQCLEDLRTAATAFGAVEIIVVDNGSTDGAFESAREFADKVLQFPRLSISALRNRARSESAAPLIACVDSDCLVPADYFKTALAILQRTGATAVGCMYELPKNVHWIEETWVRSNFSPERKWVKFLPGGNLIVQANAFDAIGGFDESLTTGEDSDFCQRLSSAGYRIFEDPELASVHLRNMSSLGEFFGRQVWQGLGAMHEWQRSKKVDKPLAATLLHLLINIAALLSLPFVLRSYWAPLLIVVAVCGVPTMTFLFRAVSHRAFYRPLRSILLFVLYLYARSWALLKSLVHE